MFLDTSNHKEERYWQFDRATHFKAQLNKAEFFSLHGHEFLRLVIDPVIDFMEPARNYNLEKGLSLSFGQKALYAWQLFLGPALNSGISGYGVFDIQGNPDNALPLLSIAQGLAYIGATDMANLLKEVDCVYRQFIKDKASSNPPVYYQDMTDYSKVDDDLIGQWFGDLDQRLESLQTELFAKDVDVDSYFEAYIRQHPDEFCVDQSGKAFNLTESGFNQTFYDGNALQYEFFLNQGLLEGEFKTFYPSGAIKKVVHYLKGVTTGNHTEYHENGHVKKDVSLDALTGLTKVACFNENGQPSTLSFKDENDHRVGDYKEWFDNGRLREHSLIQCSSPLKKKTLSTVTFWPNGKKRSELVWNNGVMHYRNYWNQRGGHTLVDGHGILTYDESEKRVAAEYTNGHRHGKTFIVSRKTNKVVLEQTFFAGELHGISRRYFYSGRLEDETHYHHGKMIAQWDRKGVYREWCVNGELKKEINLSREMVLRQAKSVKKKSFFRFFYYVPIVSSFLRFGQWGLKKIKSFRSI